MPTAPRHKTVTGHVRETPVLNPLMRFCTLNRSYESVKWQD